MKDFMHQDDIKAIVREVYSNYRPPAGEPIACKHYEPQDLVGLPKVAVDWALGVANHLQHADIAPGEVVLDLGCGSGIDTVIAARRTGPTGKVIGLDFLPEMLERTRRAASDAGLTNVQTIEGEMENIPLPDDSVDHIVSNGVINLSPRKQRVMFECARVLKLGGKFCVSDITIDEEELPAEILTHPAAWAG